MVVATVADTMKDLGALCGAVAAMLALLALVARLRPVRWLARTLIGAPASHWFRREVGEVVEAKVGPIRRQLEFNHGTSLKDAVWAIAEHTRAPVPARDVARQYEESCDRGDG